MFRIGYGFDVHAFAPERELWLGGIRIPHTQGLIGHSDADVLVHALCDAILGATNQRDIGYHFSDKDPQFKNIDSKILLSQVYELMTKAGFRMGNADCTICAEKPKLSNYIPVMQKTLGGILHSENISIKATTAEKLGFVGREEGIAAHCVVLLTGV